MDRAVHAAAPRFLCLSKGEKHEVTVGQTLELLKGDFMQALDGFLPVSMRDIAKPGGQIGPLTWGDVGGLNDTCRALQEVCFDRLSHYHSCFISKWAFYFCIFLVCLKIFQAFACGASSFN